MNTANASLPGNDPRGLSSAAAPGTNQRRKRSIVLVFMLSLLIAGVSVYLSGNYIEERVAFYRGQLEEKETLVEVVVPKRPLREGEIVRSSDLSLRKMPQKFVDTGSVASHNYETAVGQRLSFGVDEGRPMLWAHLEGGLSPTFSGKVPTGLRAITVRVDEINSISGFLQPGDRIDLLLTSGDRGEQQIFPLIQNLLVIATGVQTRVDKTGLGGQRSFTTITVKTTPDDAKKITLAQQIGKLTAMLRNPEDESTLDKAPMGVAELLNRPEEAPAVPSPPPTIVRRVAKSTKPAIEFIIGGS